MNLRLFISSTIHNFLNETNQVSDNEEIQTYVDIIDNIPYNNPKRQKYINILKDKYNFDYIDGDDESHLKNINLKDIKKLEDFRSIDLYKTYAINLLRLREKNVDYSKFLIGRSLEKDELIKLLEKYNIKSLFSKQGNMSSPTGSKDEMMIDWAGTTFPKEHILHEISHFFDDKIFIPITYTLTDYGLTNVAECTCESIMLYLCNPQYYKTILPEIATYIEKNIPEWFVKLSEELKTSF